MHSSSPLSASLLDNRNGAQRNSEGLPQSRAATATPALALVAELCRALEREEIRYCHWKSNNALDRSAMGDNDLDLLISKADAQRFTELLSRLGFKQVRAPREKQVPEVLDYFGYDDQARKLVHVHAHYQLALGHDQTKNYRVPVEEAYLDSSVQDDLFMVPAPEFEFIVFVIRMILKHSTWDVILGGEGRLKASERRELAYLLERIDRARVRELIREHLPSISDALFSNCVRALQPTCSMRTSIRTGQQLQRALQANARRSPLNDAYRKIWNRVALAVRRRAFRYSPKFRLQNQGVLIALVGGDGAGKSTAIDAIKNDLSKYFAVNRLHMGRPAWSPLTIAIRSILKIGQLLGLYPVASSLRETLTQGSPVSPGYPWLVREVCTARDRYWTYMKGRRYAAEGGIVLFDRFPVRQVQLMDGPQCERFVRLLMGRPKSTALFKPHKASRLTRAIIALEERYYDRISRPDMLIVLRVDPEIAVQRKTDEDPSSVRERSTEMWEIDWQQIDVRVVDASKSRAEVASELVALVWSQLR